MKDDPQTSIYVPDESEVAAWDAFMTIFTLFCGIAFLGIVWFHIKNECSWLFIC